MIVFLDICVNFYVITFVLWFFGLNKKIGPYVIMLFCLNVLMSKSLMFKLPFSAFMDTKNEDDSSSSFFLVPLPYGGARGGS